MVTVLDVILLFFVLASATGVGFVCGRAWDDWAGLYDDPEADR